MASVFVLLEAFNRKEAAALGFFPCATASFLFLFVRPAYWRVRVGKTFTPFAKVFTKI